jgi:cytochrome bd-type quinol oxidase subunit 1
MQQERTKYALSIPHLGSLILTHTWTGQIRGLKEFPPEDRPDSTIVFWSFRVMVGMGLLMLLLGVLGLVLRSYNRLYDTRWFQRFALAMAPSGLIALLAGWITTEVGRQPWVVYGVLRTADAISPISSQQVGCMRIDETPLLLGLLFVVFLCRQVQTQLVVPLRLQIVHHEPIVRVSLRRANSASYRARSSCV